MHVGKRLLTAFAAAAVATGCGGSKPAPAPSEPRVNIVYPGAPGERSRAAPAAAAAIAHTQADVDFMRGMIHHHQQAIVMTDWVPQRTQSTSVRLLAERMASSQGSEIEVMQRWLKDRGIDPANHAHQHPAMPGMLTSAQLERLQGADGRSFDRLFLRYMTQHHRGALTMVRQLLEKGGGAEAEIGAFTRHVDSDQQIEIGRMLQMLNRRQ